MSATISWDESSSSDINGYKIHYSEISGSYPSRQIVDVDKVTSYSLDGIPLAAGKTWYFVVTAYDTSGNGSVYSDEVSITF